jgi:hypothetical protein
MVLLHSLEVTGSAVALAGGCWKDVEVLVGDFPDARGADGYAVQTRLEACGKADLMLLEARGSADWILLEAQGADGNAAQPRSDWKRVEAPTGWCWKRRSLEDTCCADWKLLEALRRADDVEEC